MTYSDRSVLLRIAERPACPDICRAWRWIKRATAYAGGSALHLFLDVLGELFDLVGLFDKRQGKG